MKSNKVVYAWYANSLPFYIGIGSIKRSKTKNGRNSHCRNKRAKAERENCFEIRILHENLSWEEACELEQSYISLYGRVDDKTGILTNQTDGGDGRVNQIVTEDTRKKLREKSRNQKLSESHKKALRDSRIGTTHTEESKRKNRNSQSTCKTLITPFGTFPSIREAERQTGIQRKTLTNRAKSDSFPYYTIIGY